MTIFDLAQASKLQFKISILKKSFSTFLLLMSLFVLEGCSTTKAVEPAASIQESSIYDLSKIHGMKGTVFLSLDSVEWTEVFPGFETATVWGDHKTGPSGRFYRFAPNLPARPVFHKHTNSYHAVILQGGAKHWLKGQTENDVPLLKAGDYFYQQGGQWHQDYFPTDETTIMYIVYEGATDSTWEELKSSK